MYAIATALCVLLLSFGSTVLGQTAQPPAPQNSTPVDPEKLPVSLGRIRLKLSAADDRKPGLKIERMIEVVGVAPPIELWTPAESASMISGPSPFGPPTQKEILDITTPQEFKSQPIDLTALLQWLARKAKPEGKPAE
jgi:hypothetical protein